MKRYKIGSLLLAAVLAASCMGCTEVTQQPENKDSSDGADTQAMGRYVEEDMQLPEGVERYAGVKRGEDNSLLLYDYNAGYFYSEDEGITWNQADSPVTRDKYGNYWKSSAAVAPDGGCALIYDVDSVSHYLYINKAGEEKELEFSVDGPRSEDSIKSFWFSDESRLFSISYSGKVYEVNTDNSSLTLLFEGEEDIDYLTFQKNLCIGLSVEAAYIYDFQKQTLLEQDTLLNGFLQDQLTEGIVEYADNSYAAMIVPSKEDGVFYLACRDGLYRYVLYGNAMEQIIDGTLTSFGNPQYHVVSVQESGNGDYLVWFSGGKFVKYTYDKNMPTVPEKEIKIYSLEDNQVIRRAVSAFQKRHQDTYVRYVTGISNTDGVTAEDALKKFNTELAAGEGPDLFVLDDMQISALQEKGYLADISGLMEEISAQSPVFDNFMEKYTTDGKIMMFPARFKIPLLTGPEKYLENITDLTSLADSMENIRREKQRGSIMGIYKPEQAIKLLGMVSNTKWMDENGAMDQEAVKDFLTQAARIFQAELKGITAEDIQYYEGKSMSTNEFQYDSGQEAYYLNIQSNIPDIYMDTILMNAGYTESVLLDFSTVTSVIKEKEGYTFKELNGQEKHVLLPNTIMGINSRSENQELSREFLKLLFLEINEDGTFGFPVTKQAFTECSINEQGSDTFGAMGMMDKDGNFKIMNCYWPSKEDFAKLEEIVNQGVPCMSNKVINEAVYSIGQEVLTGEMSADEAVEEIYRKISIYLAE